MFTPDVIASDQPCWLPWIRKSFFLLLNPRCRVSSMHAACSGQSKPTTGYIHAWHGHHENYSLIEFTKLGLCTSVKGCQKCLCNCNTVGLSVWVQPS